jgi:hypothetical protein
VEYDRANPAPPAEFVPLTQKEIDGITEPWACLDASGEREYQNNRDPFLASWDAQTNCARGITSATFLKQREADFEQSVATLQNFINSAEYSLEQKIGSDPEGVVVIVPAGAEQTRTYNRAAGVGMVCIKSDTTTPEVLFGNLSPATGNVFVETSPELEQKVNALKEENKKIGGEREQLVERGKQEKARSKKVSAETQKALEASDKKILERLDALQQAMANDFMPIVPGALINWQRITADHKAFLGVSVQLERDEKTEKVKKFEYPLGFLNPANLVMKAYLAKKGVTGDLLVGTFKVDSESYAGSIIPQQHLEKMIKQALNKKLADFREKKAKYEGELKTVQGELAALKTKNYDCSPASADTPPQAAQATGGKVVRKSTMPARPANENAIADTNSQNPSAAITVPPKVKIILDKYRKATTEVYSCRDGTQSCLIFNKNLTSLKEETAFDYPYASTDNVNRVKTETYTESFVNTYRKNQCVLNQSFNQTAREGRSVLKCNDQDSPIYDVGITSDPVFFLFRPEYARGSGKTTITNSIVTHKTEQSITEEGEAYLIFEGGKTDTFYRVPLSVSAWSILPWDRINETGVGAVGVDGWVNRPVLCSKIRVGNQTVKGNCTIELIVRGQSKTYITPTIIGNVPYYAYSFDILVNGSNPYTDFSKTRQGETSFRDFEPEVVPPDKVPRSSLSQVESEESSYSSLAPLVGELRRKVEVLRGDRDTLKSQLEGIRKQKNYAPTPSPAEKLNAAPRRLQLGDISETLSQELGALLKIR